MEEEKKLYPFRMIPSAEVDVETVQLADLGYQDSQIRNGWLSATTISEAMEMYMDRIVGDRLFAWYGRQFPLMVRTIDSCRTRTPLMVCPDDETAQQRYDALGKEKVWYILSVTPGAELFLGFAVDTDASTLYSACLEDRVDHLLRKVKPVPGQFYHIAPGIVHAARGVRYVEVAESSPLDFKIHNWGLPLNGDDFDASLNLEAAIDLIDYKAVSIDGNGTCDLFAVREIPLIAPVRVSSSPSGGPIVYCCVSGEAAVQTEGDASKVEGMRFPSGEVALIPAEVSTFIVAPCAPDTLMLEIIPIPSQDIDEYTGEPQDNAPDHQLHIIPE